MSAKSDMETVKEESASLYHLRMLLRENNHTLDNIVEKLREIHYALLRLIGDE